MSKKSRRLSPTSRNERRVVAAAKRRPVREFAILRCLDCGHVWDDADLEEEICDCFERLGHRRSVVVSEGVTNTPKRLVPGAD